MILLTVGTYPMQFNRLIKVVDSLLEQKLITEEVFAQIGFSTYEPKNMNFRKVLNKNEFDNYFSGARLIISHAGMGSISMALDNDKSIMVFPRLKKYKEHVNDHQLHTAKKFETLGHVLAAYNEADISRNLENLDSFVPKKRIVDSEKIADRIMTYINGL